MCWTTSFHHLRLLVLTCLKMWQYNNKQGWGTFTNKRWFQWSSIVLSLIMFLRSRDTNDRLHTLKLFSLRMWEILLGVSLMSQISNEVIRHRTKVTDKAHKASKFKLQWAGYVDRKATISLFQTFSKVAITSRCRYLCDKMDWRTWRRRLAGGYGTIGVHCGGLSNSGCGIVIYDIFLLNLTSSSPSQLNDVNCWT